MLLDLNLPRKDGREVLAEVKGDPELRDDPGDRPDDVVGAARRRRSPTSRGANSYVRKPLGLDRLVEAAAAIRDFWLRTATLPSEA